MSGTTTYTDVRCILLCKSFRAKNFSVYDELYRELIKKQKQNTLEQHLALGEYDHLFTYKINADDGLLSAIRENNNELAGHLSGPLFFRPLYAVRPYDASDPPELAKKIDDFWETKLELKMFFFASIVHLTSNGIVHDGKKRVMNEVIVPLLHEAKQKGKTDGTPPLEYLIYYSLELSDYIILWKSNSPRPVLKALEYLYQRTKLLGYANTICALPTKQMKAYKKNPKSFENVFPMDDKDNFSMTIRAVTCDYYAVEQVHNQLITAMGTEFTVHQTPYFTYGNDDYLGVFPEVKANALYSLFSHEKFKTARETVNAINTTLAIKSFDGKSSPYSLKEKEEGMSKELRAVCKKMTETSNQLQNVCEQLNGECKSLLETPIFDECTWKKPVLELMNLLKSMSTSAIFDNVCFLIIDSAHEFLSWLKYMIKNPKYACSEEAGKRFLGQMEQHIECFVREWDYLSDHVVRGDGTIRQTPGYEPLIYNMCISAVEYSNAYAQKLVQYLNSFDMEMPRETQCASFVTPKLCRRFKTMQIFHDCRGGDCLIQVTIPISSILDPFLIMTSMAHEVSHYCSNKIRLRELRAEYYVKCMAYNICLYLNVYTDKALKACARQLAKNYRAHVKELNAPEDGLYLNRVKEQVERSVYSLLGQREQLEKIHHAFWADPSRTDGRSAQAIANEMNDKLHFAFADLVPPKTGDMVSMKAYINDMDYFLKECYADFFMVFILQLHKEDYLRAVFSNLLRLAKETDNSESEIEAEANEEEKVKNEGKRAQAFQRAFIIACLFDNEENDFWNNGKKRARKSADVFWESKLKEMEEAFTEKYQEWKVRKISDIRGPLNDRGFYEPTVLEFIVRYLEECRRVVEDREKLNDNASGDRRKELKEAFDALIDKDDFFNSKYQDILQDNRETMLERFVDDQKSFQFDSEGMAT